MRRCNLCDPPLDWDAVVVRLCGAWFVSDLVRRWKRYGLNVIFLRLRS